MPYKIIRQHEICAGHRIYGHESKCRHLHGHNYTFELTCAAEGERLDLLGRVIDFAVIKATLCAWLEVNWDHRMILWEADPIVNALRDIDPTVTTLPVNPTAENLAAYLVEVVGPAELAGTGVWLTAVTVKETGKCSATFEVER